MKMENPNILDLGYSVFQRIQKILDNPSTMKSFLEVIPPDCSCEDVLISMEIESRSYNMTPAKVLLTFLGNKGFRVSDLISWFEEIGLEKALSFLKREEPLKIITHPKKEMKVYEDDELLLCCRAISYPPPEYQWFKDDEELLSEIDPVLSIKSAKSKDSGCYSCLVTKWNPGKNSYDCVYSEFCNVEVIPTELHAVSSHYQDPQFSELQENSILSSQSVKVPSDEISTTSSQENNSTCSLNQTLSSQTPELKKDDLRIVRQPYVQGKLAQGMSVCLKCEAISISDVVNYQWIKNGKLLLGEISSQLVLNDLFPDPDTGDRKWVFQCEVYNESCRVFSDTAVVELDESDETTPYIAQQKLAFLVANDIYDHLENLQKPAADVKDIGNILSSLGFKVFAFRNLALTEMRNVFTHFCQMLVPGSYALFFFAGHGFDLYGQTYLQPVDCSERPLQLESMCLEYILKCMQDKKPALNILLIDACRKLPVNFSTNSKPEYLVQPGKIFRGKMKNNTIFGYSTSFLCASHESDEEENSVFVKHLKKFLAQNKCIEDILFLVKKAFAQDPITRNIQFPVIKSSLTEARKLSDPVQNSLISNLESNIMNWCDMKRELISKSFEISKLKVTIIAEFHHYMDIFCNGMDVYVFLHLEPNALMVILLDMEINLLTESTDLVTAPTNGVALKNVDLLVGRRSLLFKKEVFNLQKIKTENLQCSLLLKFCSKNITQKIDFTIDVAKISELNLSVNHLMQSNIENLSQTIVKNF